MKVRINKDSIEIVNNFFNFGYKCAILGIVFCFFFYLIIFHRELYELIMTIVFIILGVSAISITVYMIYGKKKK